MNPVTGALDNKKRVSLGSQPVTLTPFHVNQVRRPRPCLRPPMRLGLTFRCVPKLATRRSSKCSHPATGRPWCTRPAGASSTPTSTSTYAALRRTMTFFPCASSRAHALDAAFITFHHLSQDVAHVCALNAAAFPNSIALADDAGLTIGTPSCFKTRSPRLCFFFPVLTLSSRPRFCPAGTIDQVQKLHIKSVPLGEWPRRLAHQEASMTFGVLTVRTTLNADGLEDEAEFVRLLHNQTFEGQERRKGAGAGAGPGPGPGPGRSRAGARVTHLI